MTPRVLLLDFGGVVIKTPFELARAFERKSGVPAGTFAWYGPFAPERDELWCDMQAARITEREYWSARALEAGRALGERQAMTTRDLMIRIFALPEAEIVRPEAVAAITRARDAGVTVAVLTNDLAAFHGVDWYASLAVSKEIDQLIDLSHTGQLKPSAGAYALALERLAVPAASVIFVDDQPGNVAGAERAGLRSLPFEVARPEASFDTALEMLGLANERNPRPVAL